MRTYLLDSFPKRISLPKVSLTSYPGTLSARKQRGVGNVRKAPRLHITSKSNIDNRVKSLMTDNDSKTDSDLAPKWSKIVHEKQKLQKQVIKAENNAFSRAAKGALKKAYSEGKQASSSPKKPLKNVPQYGLFKKDKKAGQVSFALSHK